MIPNNQSNTNGCNPLSSNCVVWQGPDIPCLDICNGSTISDVVAVLAQTLCDSISGSITMAKDVEIDTIIQKCLATENGRNADNVQELLQWIINKLCEPHEHEVPARTYEEICAFASTCLLPLPACAHYTVGGFNVATTRTARAAVGGPGNLATSFTGHTHSATVSSSSSSSSSSTTTDVSGNTVSSAVPDKVTGTSVGSGDPGTYGGTTITEEVLYDAATNSGWIITMGNMVCGLVGSIQSITTTLNNHEQRISYIESHCCGGTTIGTTTSTGGNTVRPAAVDTFGDPVSPVGSGPTTTTHSTIQTIPDKATGGVNSPPTEQVVATYFQEKGRVVSSGTMATMVEKAVFELRRATGVATDLRSAIAYQQQGLGAEERLNGKGAMNNVPGFKPSPRTVADSIQNLWITTNDMRAAVSDMSKKIAPSACHDIVFDCQANIVRTDGGAWKHLSLDFRGSDIPTGYQDCGKGMKTKVVVSDANLNTCTFYIKLTDDAQHNGPWTTETLPGLDLTSNFVVTVYFCVTNDTNECSEKVAINVANTSPCPSLKSSAVDETEITYGYSNIAVESGGAAFITVNLLNSLGSVIQSRQHTTWATGLTGTFSGLSAGTTYQLQIQITTKGGQVTTCPTDTIVTDAPACTGARIMAKGFSNTSTDQGASANTLAIADYYDASTGFAWNWTATFDTSGLPMVLYTNTTPAAPPPTIWKHAGDFVSLDPTMPITCGETTYTAAGMRTGSEDSGWKYINALTDTSGNVYYIYALIDSLTNEVLQVVFCCDCKNITIKPDNPFGVYYCITGGKSQIKIKIVGDTSDQTILPTWNIMQQPYFGQVVYDEPSSTPNEAVFNYIHNGKTWTSDSFTCALKTSCGITNKLNIPIIRANPLRLKDADIFVYLDTTTFAYTEAQKIKNTMATVATALINTCGWNGNLYYVPVATLGTGNQEPGDYIKHLKSIVDSTGGATSKSINIASGVGTWDDWKKTPLYWTAGHGEWAPNNIVFSFVNQVGSKGLYGGATLGTGWNTPAQPTTAGYAAVNNAKYQEDYSALMDIVNGGASSKWAVDVQAAGTWKAETGAGNKDNIPFNYSHMVIDMITGMSDLSAAAALQLIGAQMGNKQQAREFYGFKIGGNQYPIDLQSYMLDGVATSPVPYTGNDTGSPANAITGLQKFDYTPHCYFENGIDWDTTNEDLKKAILGMIGVTENVPLPASCPADSSHPRMGGSNTYAFRANDGSMTATQNANATCSHAGTGATCPSTLYIFNKSGLVFDATYRAYYTEAGSTLVQKAWELADGWYVVCDGASGKKVARYDGSGTSSFWKDQTTCP